MVMKPFVFSTSGVDYPHRQRNDIGFIWFLRILVLLNPCGGGWFTANNLSEAQFFDDDDENFMDDDLVGEGNTTNSSIVTREVRWENLRRQIHRDTRLVEPTIDSWIEQCIDPFRFPFFQLVKLIRPEVSNYKLMDQADGTCMSHASCIFTNCQFPGFNSPYQLTLNNPSGAGFRRSRSLNFLREEPERLNLPERVMFPTRLSDIVSAVRFAVRNGVNISVKVGGHSYMGSSTGKGLLIKMSPTFPKYTFEQTGIRECDASSTPLLLPASTDSSLFNHPDDWLCPITLARGRPAYVRVGGGELADEVYRAVSFNWNRVLTFVRGSGKLYHLLGPAAGTVSVAGGWMASGGLSGYTGTRMWGMGIDQVIQLEMVLPNGEHVRFGPTEWNVRPRPDGTPNLYPQNNQITGWCNQNVIATFEEDWSWQPCDPNLNINFSDLWFAVRGGGGGTWGVVTAMYYQLHDYPGFLQQVEFDGEDFLKIRGVFNRRARPLSFLRVFIEFSMRFLYRPRDLGVSVQDSNNCGSSFTASLAVKGSFSCYGNSGDVMVNAWRSYLGASEQVELLTSSGFNNRDISKMMDLLNVTNFESFTMLNASPGDETGVPRGRMLDRPRSSLVPLLQSFPDYTNSYNILFPLTLLQGSEERFLELIELLVDETMGNAAAGDRNQANFLYLLGGAVPQASDGRDSLSPTRREMAFMKAVVTESHRLAYMRMIFGDVDRNSAFPGSVCHNHVLLGEFGPQKADWTQPCPPEWPLERRKEFCISFDDASWGSSNVENLLRIKREVDPNNAFVCAGAVGTEQVEYESYFTLFAGLTTTIIFSVFFTFCG